MRGGRRPGAGRKAGIPNKRTLELRALAEGQQRQNSLSVDNEPQQSGIGRGGLCELP